MKMYSSLQIGRAIAAILVVLFHLGGAISSERYFGISEFYIPFSFGASGVEFFFVLSGFIIYNAHKNDLSRPDKLYGYIKKRIIRIFPIYWVVFIGVYIVAMFTSSGSVLPTDIITIVKSLLLVPQDVGVVGGTGAPVIAVAWSLQYEVLFYIFFAFLIFNRFTGLVFFTFAFYVYISYNKESVPFPMSFLESYYILLFFMGILVSKVVEFDLSNYYIRFSGITGIGLFISLVLDTLLEFNLLKEYDIILYGLSSSLLILYVVKVEQSGYDFKRFKLLNLLGNASYSLYLIHYPIIVVLCKIFVVVGFVKFGLMSAIFAYFLIFAFCLYISILFYIKIEKPMIIYLNKVIK